ncbi:MAG: pyrroline-5-carboxylate reductase [Cephaloticoccus sp.]|nr:pyrroline-5-carboxylate reductase [Cephaloticoccus sp.]
MSKVAFLGAGNMASAIIDGLLANKSALPTDLSCYTPGGRSAMALATRTGVTHAKSLPDLLRDCDVLLVAFKPQHLAQADPALQELTAGKLVISVLSGKKISSLQRVFPLARNWVRAMPNTPARIGAGITAWVAQSELTSHDRSTVESILGALGRALELQENDLDAVTAVSASGAGFVFEFAGAMRSAAEAAGLDPVTAKLLVVETLLGSSRLMARTNEEPESLRDQVTSPNGTTLAGLNRLKAGNFRQLIQDAVLAAKARAGELSQDT